MTRLRLLLPFVFFAPMLSAQPSIQWEESLGGSSNDQIGTVIVSAHGGYLVAGRSESTDGDVTGNHGGPDGWVAKLDSLGGLEWEESLGGSDLESFRKVLNTNDGGYLLAGRTASNDGDVIGFHGLVGSQDIWIVKIDSAGNIQWSRTYGGSGFEFLLSIRSSRNGGFIISGRTNSTDGDLAGRLDSLTDDAWIFKIDTVGNMVWQKYMGGSSDEDGGDIYETADGGYITGNQVSGTTDGDVVGNTDTAAGASSIWIVKLDSARNIQWQHLYGGTGQEQFTYMLPVGNGSFLVGATTSSNDNDVSGNHGNSDGWLFEIDSLGTIGWQRCYGGSSSETLEDFQAVPGGYLMTIDAFSNDSEVTGNHGYGDIWIVKTDTVGNIAWEQCYGGSLSDQGWSITPTPDNGCIFGGYSVSNDGDVSGHHGIQNKYDGWVVKLAPLPNAVKEPESPLHAIGVYPNPASTQAVISFVIEKSCDVAIQVYNILGQKWFDIAHQHFSAGEHKVRWNMNAYDSVVPAGMYFVRVEAGEYSGTSVIQIMH